MKPDDVRTLIDYHYWARDRALDAVELLTPEQFMRDLGNSFRSVRDTVVHIYFADGLWYSRWEGTPPTWMIKAEQFPDVASLRSAWGELEAKIRAFFADLDAAGMERPLEYRALNGQPATSVMWHMLQHVVNHGSYHRGQLTTLLRQLGAAPPKSMDLIAFYREHSARAV
jgi:uncharacterized damage-inducible protein DinB